MKKSILYSVTAALLGLGMFASESPAAPPGGGGGGGGGGNCYTCSCSVTGTIGGHTCWCPSTSNGGSGCLITYVPGIGNDCQVKLGPCKAPIWGFAP